MGGLDDVQTAILSFALNSVEGVDSIAFQKLLADYSIDIHDVVLSLDNLQSKIENFLICLDGEL